MTKNKPTPEIVTRALTQSVLNIGQLSREELRDLNYAVRKGTLMKIQDYNAFPIPKWRYTRNWLKEG